jgi:hypothetical protein|tara:strand:- start:633 stop:884 length:252 start_codon:yes stop_codon:yes gene_type:complete
MKNSKEYGIMKRTADGELVVRDHFPEDVKVAVTAFLAAGKMMVDEGLDYLPSDYLVNLLETLSKYPEYNNLTMDLYRAYDKEI